MRWSVLLCVLVLLTSLNYWKIWSWPSSKCQVYSRLLRSEPILGIRSARLLLWFDFFFFSVKYGFCSGWFSSTLRWVMSCTWLDRSNCYTQALHRLKGNCYITCLRLLSLCSQEATLDVDCESGVGAASVKLDALNVSLSLFLSLSFSPRHMAWGPSAHKLSTCVKQKIWLTQQRTSFELTKQNLIEWY